MAVPPPPWATRWTLRLVLAPLPRLGWIASLWSCPVTSADELLAALGVSWPGVEPVLAARALCATTQMLARLLNPTELWIERFTLELPAVLLGRFHRQSTWPGLSALVAAGYGLGCGVSP